MSDDEGVIAFRRAQWSARIISVGKRGHIKSSLGGVSTYLHGAGEKTELMNSARKIAIEDIKAMQLASLGSRNGYRRGETVEAT